MPHLSSRGFRLSISPGRQPGLPKDTQQSTSANASHLPLTARKRGTLSPSVLLCAAALALTALASPAAYANNTLSSGAAVEGATMIKATEPSAAGRSAFPGLTTIRSRANGLLVSTELGHPGDGVGMLRARAHGVGPWEQYDVIASGGAWSIRSRANARYVSAELGYTGNNYGMLRARATAVGPWEKYDLSRLSSGAYALRSQANGRYVSAELGYTGGNYGMLRARATAIGPWEQFYLN